MLLNQYGLSLGLTGQFIESKKFHKKGIRIALQTNDFENLGVNEYHYGTNLHLQGKYVLAKQHTEISIQHLLKTNNLLFLAPAYRLMGITTFFLGNTQSSIQYLEKGLQLLQKLKVDYLVSLFHYSYGLIHMEIGDCDKGSLKLKESLKLARKNGERWVEGVSFIGLGRCSGMMGADHIDKAEESFSNGLKILDVLRLKPYYAQGLLYFGEMYLNAGIYDQALEHLNQAEEMFETMVMEFWQGRAFLLLADYSKQQGDVQKARELLGRALEIFQAGETLGWIKACEQKLVEIS